MDKKEFIDKYGDTEVELSSYFKFTFCFTGKVGETVLHVEVGGCSDDIYRDHFEVGKKYIVSDLDPYAGSAWNKGSEDESFYDY